MTASYAELVQACSEFQENFCILKAKFNSQAEELKQEGEAHERAKEKILELEKRDEQRSKKIDSLLEELTAANNFKTKYLEANVTIESLKLELEQSKRNVVDAAVEHEEEVKQLRGQLRDMEKRLETASCTNRVKDLQKQVMELEEKCAVVNAQLLEERATAGQHILSSQSALREQQAQNLELAQRLRSMETEFTDMRATVRRSAKLQNDAALMKDRFEMERASSEACIEDLRRELQEVHTALETLKTDSETARHTLKRSGDEERRSLNDRISSLTSMHQKAMAELLEERDRVSALQSEVQRSAQVAREESMAEALALRKGMSLLKEDLQREHFAVQKLEENLEANRRLLENEEGRNAALLQQQKQFQVQLDAALQQEAWAQSEKRHSEERLLAMQRHLEEISEKAKRNDHLGMEVDRLQMQLKFREDELLQTQRCVHQLESKLYDNEEAATQQLQSFKKETRHLRKQLKTEEAKSDSLRRKLLRALVDKEQESNIVKAIRGGNGANMLHQLSSLPQVTSTATAMQEVFASDHTKKVEAADQLPSLFPLGLGGPFNNFDVLELLRSQTEKAAHLHDRLAAL